MCIYSNLYLLQFVCIFFLGGASFEFSFTGLCDILNLQMLFVDAHGSEFLYTYLESKMIYPRGLNIYILYIYYIQIQLSRYMYNYVYSKKKYTSSRELTYPI